MRKDIVQPQPNVAIVGVLYQRFGIFLAPVAHRALRQLEVDFVFVGISNSLRFLCVHAVIGFQCPEVMFPDVRPLYKHIAESLFGQKATNTCARQD